MSDHMKKKILIVGAGPMAVEHFKVCQALGAECVVVGRSENSARKFAEASGQECISGGLDAFLADNKQAFDAAIVAVGMEVLASTTTKLLTSGFSHILVEKPGGMNSAEIIRLAETSTARNASVVLAYNRRFYASVVKAEEIISADNGLLSFNFEFTEWAHTIEPLQKAPGVKEAWLLGNSSHVIDLAFFIGGAPKQWSAFAGGSLSWHERAQFSGAGVSEKGCLFSYQANWSAPGRWGVELLTAQSRLYLRPMEGLAIQAKGSVAIHPVELDDQLDKQFKPGVYLQNQAFLNGELRRFKSIQQQAKDVLIYSQIAKGSA